MKKLLLLMLLAASSSCFAMDKDNNKQVLDAGTDPMQAALLKELKNISCELKTISTKINSAQKSRKEKKLYELHVVSQAIQSCKFPSSEKTFLLRHRELLIKQLYSIK